MGNPLKDGVSARSGAAAVTRFYSSAAWIEGKAVDQLEHVAALEGVRRPAPSRS